MSTIDEIRAAIELADDPVAKRELILGFLKSLPTDSADPDLYRTGLELTASIENLDERCSVLSKLTELTPKLGDFIPLYIEIAEAAVAEASRIEMLKHRKSAVLRVASDVPETPEFAPLYGKIMSAAIDASGQIEDKVARRSSLVEIAGKLKERETLLPLSLHALRVSLGLAEGEAYRKYSLKEIAKELPKSCDYAFYRKHTFFGIASSLKKEGNFLELYKEAIAIAIKAAGEIEQPFYAQYALLFIANELPKTGDFHTLYKEALSRAFETISVIEDPITKQRALLDLFKLLPKETAWAELILKTIEESLRFFTFKRRMDEMEPVDVMDFFILSEERKMTESKRKRFAREKYGELFAAELNKNKELLSDIRLIEMLKPYTHVWVRPVVLRDAARQLLEHLVSLTGRYHGREIEAFRLVKREYFEDREHPATLERAATPADEIIAIDLGATNTVVMRKAGAGEPEFIDLGPISGRRDGATFVPTRIDPASGEIGASVSSASFPREIKKNMLNEGSRDGALMERYLHALYRHIKNASGAGGLRSLFGGKPAEKIYVTVPVGYEGYRAALLRMMKGIAKGVELELIEEPLAAAIGYQVADEEDKLVMLFDFGGCTLDIMLLRINLKGLHVVAKPDRSKMLGGGDVDLWLAEYLAGKCGETKKDLPPGLMAAAEEIKISLSEQKTVPFQWEGKEVCTVSRDDFESLLEERDFYNTVEREVGYVLGKARKVGVEQGMIDAVLLTGGSSQIPSFKEKIEHSFPKLREKNGVYDHSPLTAVVRGAVLYGSHDVTDRHLGMACAIRHVSGKKDEKEAYELVFEKGETLPFEKRFAMKPASLLGPQEEIYIELFEVPDRFLSRRWVSESGMESIRQTLKQGELELKALKIVTLPLGGKMSGEMAITFSVDRSGWLKIKCGDDGAEIDSGLRLQ